MSASGCVGVYIYRLLWVEGVSHEWNTRKPGARLYQCWSWVSDLMEKLSRSRHSSEGEDEQKERAKMSPCEHTALCVSLLAYHQVLFKCSTKLLDGRAWKLTWSKRACFPSQWQLQCQWRLTEAALGDKQAGRHIVLCAHMDSSLPSPFVRPLLHCCGVIDWASPWGHWLRISTGKVSLQVFVYSTRETRLQLSVVYIYIRRHTLMPT